MILKPSYINSIKNHIKEQRLFFRRIIAAAVIIAMLMTLLIARLVYLQIYQHKLYATLSSKNHLELLPIEPNRGLIYDRNGILLAKNIPVFSLDLVPDQISDLSSVINELQQIITINQNDLDQFYKSASTKRRFDSIPLKLTLTEAEVAKFSVNQYRFPGVIINARMIRYYPLSDITSSIVGYVGRIDNNDLENLDPSNYSASNFIGKAGIEKYYEQQLHGHVGYQQVEIDASGRIVRTVQYIKPTPGNNIHLSIDSNLQKTAFEALGSEKGSVVAIEPKTGKVLALVSTPSFDPNLFVQGISNKDYSTLQNSPDKPLYNRALLGQFPMASTIKPFFALEGLESKVITPTYSFYDPGWFKLPSASHIYRDWNWERGGHGIENVTKAIIVSSDPFFYNLAIMLGINRMDDILNRFGFGRKTGIDLPQEASGLLPTPEWKLRTQGNRWYAGDTVISGIGQGFMLTTPLQLAMATATLADRGQRFQPQLLLDSPPIPSDPVMLTDKQAWDVVIDALQKVVTSKSPQGTARIRFGTPKYTVAAKTGTGQVYSKHSRDEYELSESKIPKQLRNHSLFIAFAPVDDPQIAIAVIVENSPIAGTVARKILDYYLVTEHEQKQPGK